MDSPTILLSRDDASLHAELSRTARRMGTLPPEMLRQARGRLLALSSLFAVLTAIDLLFAVNSAFAVQAEIVSDAIVLVACLAVATLARLRAVPDQIALDAGLVLQVLLCFMVSLMSAGLSWRTLGVVPFVDWSTPLILLFPLIVPTAPLRSGFTALAAASMPALSLVLLADKGVLALADVPLPEGAPVGPLVAVSASPLVAALIAGITSKWIYGLGRDVARARELGAYRLVEKLGAGAMGEVWRGDHHLLARPAAIKLMRPTGHDGAAETLARFEREAQATASLCSPHTIRLFDFGASDDGVFYYVMELLDGYDLESLVQRFGPLPPRRAVALLRQVCASLAEAHEAGLIHRDVKPANVFVCHYGRDVDFVKVLDFGLVKSNESAGDAGFETREFSVNGTPAYMAPEQGMGATTLDARTDIYAVGCVAYWLLTGCLVFDEKRSMELIVAHARSTPVPPSARTEIHVPEALDALVMRCLEKDPDARPASADELDAELARLEAELGRWERHDALDWWQLHPPARAGDQSEAKTRLRGLPASSK